MDIGSRFLVQRYCRIRRRSKQALCTAISVSMLLLILIDEGIEYRSMDYQSYCVKGRYSLLQMKKSVLLWKNIVEIEFFDHQKCFPMVHDVSGIACCYSDVV